MKPFFYILISILLLTVNPSEGYCQLKLTGKVIDKEDRNPVANAAVYTSDKRYAVTNDEGQFELVVSNLPDTLFISHIAYKNYKFLITDNLQKTILLEPLKNTLEEVTISTGYYSLPKERLTGSFSQISTKDIERTVSSNILDKMETMVPGLHFDRRNAGRNKEQDQNLSLRLRGTSTIYADMTPLIVVDNFPFDGDVNNINPNDVETITFLKDAAAASIWGARAANGVIVITTKGGGEPDRIGINFTSNLSLKEKPDLYYTNNFINPKLYIEQEKEWFEAGIYTARVNNASKPVLSPVIEMLIKIRDGKVSPEDGQSYFDSLAENDVRRDADRFLYQQGVVQRYSLDFSGEVQKNSFRISVGYDGDRNTAIGDGSRRTTLFANNRWSILSNLNLHTSLNYAEDKRTSNSFDIRSSLLLPYYSLHEADGSFNAFVRDFRPDFIVQSQQDGLNWWYRPMEELMLNNNSRRTSELRLNGTLNYEILSGLAINIMYQYHKIDMSGRNLMDQESYYVRNLVNRFTPNIGPSVFPKGDILALSRNTSVGQSGRFQINYNKTWSDGELHLLGGAEIREVGYEASNNSYYGYSDGVLTFNQQHNFNELYPVRPFGSLRIPTPAAGLGSTIDRYISYYSNGSYILNNRYIVSGSLRWDESNLFGVKTNQKGVPLWSTGLSWDIDKEDFFNADWISNLKLRTTYGVSGNVDKSVTAYPTVRYQLNSETRLPMAEILSPGNDNLRWEKTKMANVGLDFSLFNRLLNASVDFFDKKSTDLIANRLIDPTLFFNGTLGNVRVNYAHLVSKGMDVNIETRPIGGKVRWNMNGNYSFSKNKITKLLTNDNFSVTSYTLGLSNRAVLHQSIDNLYSLPWWGIEAETGDPLVNQNGKLNKEYTQYINSLNIEDMVVHGSTVPISYGAIRNNIRWRDFELSVNISFKLDYFFRNESISYNTWMQNYSSPHKDYERRWIKQGDELVTDIPSVPSRVISNRDVVYLQSEALAEKGDHIRLQDIRFQYDKRIGTASKMLSMQFFAFANNLGLIWKSTKSGVDPDYPSSFFLPSRSISFGVKLNY